jgi:predicted transcriptional regulator of viral defense system
MTTLEKYLEHQLIHGRFYFTKEAARKELKVSAEAFTAAASRLARKERLVSPWRGFYVILRPEDQVYGAPDPVRWIDPLMKYLKLDYRISLLRAAAFHGSSHQSAMVFQVILSKQLRGFELGRHRIQFVYQNEIAFAETNKPSRLQQLKSETGFAKVAGLEITLLDCARYFHAVGGINSLAQITYDIGKKVDPLKLGKVADFYENSSVRRLGYLLSRFGYEHQALSLSPFVKTAKSFKPLDPSVKPIIGGLSELPDRDSAWMLVPNVPLEINE